ncbi:hypothetical protein [Polaromonas sp. CG9_12]|nr:hypothetical protein [Polaromonas sp. CG9_12]
MHRVLDAIGEILGGDVARQAHVHHDLDDPIRSDPIRAEALWAVVQAG